MTITTAICAHPAKVILDLSELFRPQQREEQVEEEQDLDDAYDPVFHACPRIKISGRL
jgi:hypothetical protein